MLHRVPGERGVVRFDVELEMIEQIVFAQEIQAGRGVGIVLVLRRFLWFRLDEKLALEADGFLVVHRHVQEFREMFLFALEVGVEQGRVTLASAPKDVARAAEFVRDFERLLHLRGGEREHVGIATRGRAVHVTRIGKEIGRAPEQLDAGALLFFLQNLHDGVEVLVRLAQVFAFGATSRSWKQ